MRLNEWWVLRCDKSREIVGFLPKWIDAKSQAYRMGLEKFSIQHPTVEDILEAFQEVQWKLSSPSAESLAESPAPASSSLTERSTPTTSQKTD